MLGLIKLSPATGPGAAHSSRNINKVALLFGSAYVWTRAAGSMLWPLLVFVTDCYILVRTYV